MSGGSARILEVFPMRLGRELLLDLTLEPGPEVEPPKPGDTVLLLRPEGKAELTVWAAPRIAAPEGSRRLNLQFRREDLGDVRPEEGMTVLWG